MKKKGDLAKRLARQARLTPGAAADQIDTAVARILKNLRKGAPASLPGLGIFIPGRKPNFRFTSAPKRGEP